MKIQKFVSMILTGAVCVSTFGATMLTPLAAHADDASMMVPIQFQNDLQLGYNAQDVFVQSATDATRVVRATPAALDDVSMRVQPLYAVASAMGHDYFKQGIAPTGPFDMGRALNLTLDEWLGAAGAGSYQSDGPQARIDVSFTGLVPFATYTVWCDRVTAPPMPAIKEMPCGDVDGIDNSFMTNSVGAGKFSAVLATPLPPSDTRTATVISVVWNSDQATHGDRPGDYGIYAHEHLMFFFPVTNGTPAPTPSGNTCMQIAVNVRDGALKSALQTYATSLTSALDARASALTSAWAMTDVKARAQEISAAWKVFTQSRRAARVTLNATRHQLWGAFGHDRKVCAEPRADSGGEAQDAQW